MGGADHFSHSLRAVAVHLDAATLVGRVGEGDRQRVVGRGVLAQNRRLRRLGLHGHVRDSRRGLGSLTRRDARRNRAGVRRDLNGLVRVGGVRVDARAGDGDGALGVGVAVALHLDLELFGVAGVGDGDVRRAVVGGDGDLADHVRVNSDRAVSAGGHVRDGAAAARGGGDGGGDARRDLVDSALLHGNGGLRCTRRSAGDRNRADGSLGVVDRHVICGGDGADGAAVGVHTGGDGGLGVGVDGADVRAADREPVVGVDGDGRDGRVRHGDGVIQRLIDLNAPDRGILHREGGGRRSGRRNVDGIDVGLDVDGAVGGGDGRLGGAEVVGRRALAGDIDRAGGVRGDGADVRLFDLQIHAARGGSDGGNGRVLDVQRGLARGGVGQGRDLRAGSNLDRDIAVGGAFAAVGLVGLLLGDGDAVDLGVGALNGEGILGTDVVHCGLSVSLDDGGLLCDDRLAHGGSLFEDEARVGMVDHDAAADAAVLQVDGVRTAALDDQVAGNVDVLERDGAVTDAVGDGDLLIGNGGRERSAGGAVSRLIVVARGGDGDGAHNRQRHIVEHDDAAGSGRGVAAVRWGRGGRAVRGGVGGARAVHDGRRGELGVLVGGDLGVVRLHGHSAVDGRALESDAAAVSALGDDDVGVGRAGEGNVLRVDEDDAALSGQGDRTAGIDVLSDGLIEQAHDARAVDVGKGVDLAVHTLDVTFVGQGVDVAVGPAVAIRGNAAGGGLFLQAEAAREHDEEGLASQCAVGIRLIVAHAVQNAGGVGLGDVAGEPCVGGHVGKGGRSLSAGEAEEFAEYLCGLRARHVVIGPEAAFVAGYDTVIGPAVDGSLSPVTFCVAVVCGKRGSRHQAQHHDQSQYDAEKFFRATPHKKTGAKIEQIM